MSSHDIAARIKQIQVRTDVTRRTISFCDVPYIRHFDYWDGLMFPNYHDLISYDDFVNIEGHDTLDREGRCTEWNDVNTYEVKYEFSHKEPRFTRRFRLHFIESILQIFANELADAADRAAADAAREQEEEEEEDATTRATPWFDCFRNGSYSYKVCESLSELEPFVVYSFSISPEFPHPSGYTDMSKLQDGSLMVTERDAVDYEQAYTYPLLLILLFSFLLLFSFQTLYSF